MAKALTEKHVPEKSAIATSTLENQPPEHHSDISAMPFEQAMSELETIVDRLEKGSVGLEESITIYERGEALKRHCGGLLKAAEQRIEKITIGANGAPSGTKALDVDETPF